MTLTGTVVAKAGVGLGVAGVLVGVLVQEATTGMLTIRDIIAITGPPTTVALFFWRWADRKFERMTKHLAEVGGCVTAIGKRVEAKDDEIQILRASVSDDIRRIHDRVDKHIERDDG
jgi:hypothetical protein